MNRPAAPFIVLLALALVVLFFEYQTVRDEFDTVASIHASNEAKRTEIDGRTAKLTSLKQDLPAYQEAFDQLLGAYTPVPLETNAFGALYNLNPIIKHTGLQPVVNRAAGAGPRVAGSPTFTYEVTSTSVEFHKLVPALADTENLLPLLRFTKLSLTSPQDPFYMEATPLNLAGTFSTIREGAAIAAAKEVLK